MKSARVRPGAVTGLLSVVLVALTSGAAHATAACFTAFTGGVSFVFDITQLQVAERVVSPIVGRVSGASLASCGGLSEWPLYGSGILSSGGGLLTLAFRVGTNDVSSCGAVDYQVQLSTVTFNGPLALHNTRTGATGTSTMTLVACPAPAAAEGSEGAASAVAPGPTDVQGNSPQ